MTANTEKSFIRKALESISNGNATALKKNIKEALLSKVRRALDEREKKIAKSLINKKTKK
jgi:DNA-directed RNA polymerase specialized sigma subunit